MTERLPEPEQHMTPAQEATLRHLCDRYFVAFSPEHYQPQFDLPPDYLAGWIGGPEYGHPLAERWTIYVGVSGDGEATS